MMILKRGLNFIGCKTCHLARFSSIVTSYEGLLLPPKYSVEEQEKILEVLNNSNTEQLSRFNVSQNRIKNMQLWKDKKGPFKSLADVLEVDNLGVKVLDRLCESIITIDNQGSTEVATKEKSVNNRKNQKQYLTPSLDNEQVDHLKSAVGIHLGPSGVSWTKIFREYNCVVGWDYYNFNGLSKKMLPTDTFQLAMTILNKIPVGDVYIFEAAPNISMQSSKPVAVVSSYNQQQELNSMLLALLNTSAKHSFQHPSETNSYMNNVYYLRAYLSARLFSTLMGTERVSSTTAVSNLLEHTKTGTKHNLPCGQIQMEELIMSKYNLQSPVVKELLGQSLLLIIAFMEVCINKHPVALTAISPHRKNSVRRQD